MLVVRAELWLLLYNYHYYSLYFHLFDNPIARMGWRCQQHVQEKTLGNTINSTHIANTLSLWQYDEYRKQMQSFQNTTNCRRIHKTRIPQNNDIDRYTNAIQQFKNNMKQYAC